MIKNSYIKSSLVVLALITSACMNQRTSATSASAPSASSAPGIPTAAAIATTPRLTNTILMVRPADFGFNEETGVDNEFQKHLAISADQINQQANVEFQNMVNQLKGKGVSVLVLEPQADRKVKTPDAVFPNNWFSTESDGTIITYPMKAANRRAEQRPDDVKKLLAANGYVAGNVVAIGRPNESEQFLEGTGSMIIDHKEKIVYAAESERTNRQQFERFITARSYKKGVLFSSQSVTGKPIYHTNVIMSVGEGYAVICSECITTVEQRTTVLSALHKYFNSVVEITYDQVTHFAGNTLAVRGSAGKQLIVMSQSAYGAFTPAQLKTLAQYGEVVPVAIPTIEGVGGGSARCMMAEIFSPQKS